MNDVPFKILFRFVNTDGSVEGQIFLGEDDVLKGDLTPAMDIFSAGYVNLINLLTVS